MGYSPPEGDKIKAQMSATARLLASIMIVGLLPTASRAQMTEVKMGLAFVSARATSLWVAEREGYFRKHGIDLKLLQVRGGTQGAQALLSGGIDMSFADPASTISAVAAGAELIEVMAITTIMPYYLVGAPGVKSVAALKGKRVASSGMGLSSSRLALLVAFPRLGLDPARDNITLVGAGAEPERVAALASGAIAATVLAPEFRSRIDQLGLNILADLRALNIAWEHDAVVTSRKTLQTRRDMVERVVKALLEGNAFVLNPANRASVLELLRTRLGLKSREDANGAYEELVRYYVLRKPYPSREGIMSIAAEIAKFVPSASRLRFEDLADQSIVERLDRSGFIDNLYKK